MPAAPRKPKTPPPSRPAHLWKRHLFAVAALWTLALIAYSNSFTGAMVADNGPLILDDARVHAVTVRNLNLILGQHYWFGNGESNLYRPITTLSFLFNYAVLGNGTSEAGYHALNFALHAVNIALIYLLALWIFNDLAPAFLMSAIWALHPILTESVTNIVGRSDMLAGFAVLGGLVCHILATRAASRRLWWRAALFCVVAIGMFSKENAIVVIGVMALWDLLIDRPTDWRSRLPNYAVAAVPCLAFLYVRSVIAAKSLYYFVPFTDNPLASTDFWTARMTAIKVIGKYLKLLVWPVSLSSDYSYNEIPLFSWRWNTFEDWKTPIALLLCIALIAVAIRYRRRDPRVSFFIGLFFVTLAPTANLAIIIGTPMAERFLYLPAVAMAGCTVIAVYAVLRRLTHESAQNHRAIAILAAIALLFALRTHARNNDWDSDGSLTLSASQSAPNSYKPHMVLSVMLTDQDRAVAEADRAHQILDGLPDDHNSMKSYTNFGICYRDKGDHVAADSKDPSAAREWYRKSLRDLLHARSIEQAFDTRLQLGNRLRGRAHTNFGWFPVYLELGRTYLRLSQPGDALQALQHGMMLEFRAEFFEELSKTYRAMGDSRLAAIALLEGIAMQPSQSQLATQLADLYSQTAPQSCAVRESGGTHSANMDCPMVKEQACAAMVNVVNLYEQVGRHTEAALSERARTEQMRCHQF